MAVSLCGLTGRPGELVRGRWALPVTLPGGGVPEAIPVVIATGRDADAEAPRLLLSANVHGPEYNGLIVAHRVIEWLETAAPSGLLRGTVVVFPNLNPSGHRGGTRWPVFDSGIDPNRQWPDARPLAARDPAVVAGFSNGYSGELTELSYHQNGLDAPHQVVTSPPETTTIVQSDERGGSNPPQARQKTHAWSLRTHQCAFKSASPVEKLAHGAQLPPKPRVCLFF